MIRTLLVDDEQPARLRLRQLLSSFEDIEIVAEAVDGRDALDKITAYVPDLVFLDIQMPGHTGLEVAASLVPPRPKIIFCTAYDQYAIDAFEVHAVDYLLKPVSRNRLAKTVGRIRESMGAIESMMRDLESARQVQSRLFPGSLPAMDHLDYQAYSRPARTVNGDYYDFLLLDSRTLAIVLADVSGKGLPAGLVMASLQGRVHGRAPDYGCRTAALLTDLNRLMCQSGDGKSYVTFFYAVYDDAGRTLTYTNAGHNPPYLWRAMQEQPARLDGGGTVIGLLPHAEYTEVTVSLESEDLIVCYTDGISESFSVSGEEFGESRLAASLAKNRHLGSASILDGILRDVDQFSTGAIQQDDQTLIVAKMRS